MTERSAPLTGRRVLVFWAPLALMWLAMSIEQPLVAALIGRLPAEAENLAAWGLTFSLALIVESPVIMLLTAGTALAVDRAAYRLLWRFTAALAVGLGVLHLAIGLSPAYEWIMGRLVGAPDDVVALSRLAFVSMVAWTPAIAVRRLWQGVMIGHDRPRPAGVTTLVRLAVLAALGAIGLATAALPGAWLAGLIVSVAVTVEAGVAYVLVRPTLANLSDPAPGDERPAAARSLTALLDFYVPLALTSFIILGGQPLVSVGLGRAPDALTALAVWPVLMGLLFVFRSTGYAYQEAVVALVDRPGGEQALRRVALVLAAVLSVIMALVALTPLAGVWLEQVSGLEPGLAAAGRRPLAYLIPVPALSTLIAWHRGQLVGAGRTTAITQAVAINLGVLAGGLFLGLWLTGGLVPGAELASLAFSASLLIEDAWLWYRARQASPAESTATHGVSAEVG